jgi:glutamine cyclotransferase
MIYSNIFNFNFIYRNIQRDKKLYEIFKRDKRIYIQGMTYHGDTLYESSGLYSKSFVRKIENINTIKKRITYYYYDNNIFAEGICILNNKLYGLAWKKTKLFEFDLNLNIFNIHNLNPTIKEFWGLTTDGTYLIISNGSNNLFYIDQNWNIEKILTIPNTNRLNELEHVYDRYIYANIYKSDIIVIIDEKTSKIIKELDFEFLRDHEDKYSKELNGIAFNSINDTVVITGKDWKNNYVFPVEYFLNKFTYLEK